jgi:acetyltransferase-like isoleucine patch superfamily enzyme
MVNDWYGGSLPANVDIAESVYIETTYSFVRYRSQAATGLRMAHAASAYGGTMFDIGPRGKVRIGEYALVHGAWIRCDSEVDIGDFSLISWNVVLMDTYRAPADPARRRRILEAVSRDGWRGFERASSTSNPIRIGRNVWIGFDVCVLPGVHIGDGSIVGARSVVDADVPEYSIVAGNPARVIRELPKKK